jgi:hypothetical protein
MLPPNLCPEHYMFLLTVSKDNHAGSLLETPAIQGKIVDERTVNPAVMHAPK